MPQAQQSVHTFKTNFTSGELTDKLDARIDWSKHQNGARIIQNFMVQSYGGVVRRAGTFFISSTKFRTKQSMLKKFEFSVSQAYTVEIGDLYMRFFTNRALVRNATETPACQLFLSAEFGYGITVSTRTSPAAQLTLGATSGNDVNVVASVGVFVAGDVGKTILSGTGRGIIDQFTSATQVRMDITSTFPGTVLASGSWQLSFPYFTSDEADRERLITLPNSGFVRTAIFINNFEMTADVLKQAFLVVSPVASGQWSIEGTPVELVTPYVEADIPGLRFDQSADVMYISHANYAPRKLARINPTSFSLTLVTFDPPPSVEQPILPAAALTLGATSGNGIAATTDVAAFLNADVGRQIAAGIGRASIVAFTSASSITVDILDTFASVGPFASGTWELRGSPATQITPSAFGPVGSIITLTLAAAGWRSSDVGKFVVVNDGLVKITIFTSSTVVSGEVLSKLKDATAQPSGSWSLEVDAWSTSLGFPRNVRFHQQRLFFSSNNNQPQTFWGSQTADYENFAIGAKDSDSVQYTISEGGVNLIRWMITGQGKLILGSVGGEFRVWGGSDKVVITPSNIQVDPQSAWGCDVDVDASSLGGRFMFLQRGGSKIREMGFDLQEDAYVADDITVFAEHLTRAGFLQLDYCKTPDSIVLAVAGDGKLMAMTYEKKEQVYAWARQITLGSYESICVIPNKCGTSDEVWAIINRTVEGATKRYVELFDGALTVDCARLYSNTGIDPITKLRDLRHINGMAYAARIGAVSPYTVASGTVANGEATFPSTTDVQVGLSYLPRTITLRAEFDTGEGTAASRRKRWNEIILRVYASNGTWTVNGRNKAMPSGDFTGDVRVTEIGWDREGRITITIPDPVPATLLGITGAIQADDG